jgi:hypothetical protein
LEGTLSWQVFCGFLHSLLANGKIGHQIRVVPPPFTSLTTQYSLFTISFGVIFSELLTQRVNKIKIKNKFGGGGGVGFKEIESSDACASA